MKAIVEQSNKPSDNDNLDYTLKCLVVGEPGAGKTSILNELNGDNFVYNRAATIGIDFHIANGKVTNESGEITRYKMQLWDCAGQARFRSIVRSYFRLAQLIVIVYDVCDYSSFDFVRDWKQSIAETLDPSSYVLLLVGNKCDFTEERVVSLEDGQTLSQKEGFDGYFDVSAKTGDGVFHAFEEGLLIAHQRIKDGSIQGMRPVERVTSAIVTPDGEFTNCMSGCTIF